MWSLNEEAQTAGLRSQEAAARLGSNQVGAQHLLLGLLADPTNVACCLLISQGIEVDQLRQRIEDRLVRGLPIAKRGLEVTFSARRTFTTAFEAAASLDDLHLGTEHLLLALVCQPSEDTAHILRDMNLDEAAVRQAILNRRQLLRAANSPSFSSSELLRPVHEASRSNPEELLRGSDGSAAEDPPTQTRGWLRNLFRLQKGEQ